MMSATEARAKPQRGSGLSEVQSSDVSAAVNGEAATVGDLVSEEVKRSSTADGHLATVDDQSCDLD